MWCEKCQADVAAEASRDNQRLSCTACGSELKVAVAQSSGTHTSLARDPRELLARWAQEDAADPFGPLMSPSREAGNRSGRSKDDGTALRLDLPHTTAVRDSAPAEHRSTPSPALSAPSSMPVLPSGYMLHPPHPVPGPHFDAQPEVENKSTNWVAFAAQMVSYLGVITLTTGTVLVLMGHFGGHAQYAPMGWLVTTAGQMLLFLGVVTLISSGMEQTTHDVARRIDGLGEKLFRVEQTAAWTAARLHGASPDTPAPAETAENARTAHQIREQIARLNRQLERL